VDRQSTRYIVLLFLFIFSFAERQYNIRTHTHIYVRVRACVRSETLRPSLAQAAAVVHRRNNNNIYIYHNSIFDECTTLNASVPTLRLENNINKLQSTRRVITLFHIYIYIIHIYLYDKQNILYVVGKYT